MLIKLSPQFFLGAELAVSKLGDVLTVNGVALDFSRLADGATLPAPAVGSEWIAGDIERIAGNLVVMLRLPHGADAPEVVRFPSDISNLADGPISLPTGAPLAVSPGVPGVIDWSQVITADMKVEAAALQMLASVQAEIATRRAVADVAIAPLQDAVDLEDATEAEAELLKDWKRYRVTLNRLPEQPGYPDEIDWPAPPA